MDWHRPQFLYLILPLCVSWLALVLFSEKRRQHARESFAAQAMWPQVLPVSTRARFWTKQLLQQLAVIFSLMALAGPQFGTQLDNVVARGSDLYVLIDVSRSMLAQDVPPSRLERARADVSALVNRLEGERIGLIAFAGQAVVKCPLTVDYDSFRRALNELDTNSAPRGGTAIGDAIRKALEVFHAKAERDQAVLLITDGDDQQSYPLEAAAVAAERKVTVFTVGLGDPIQGSRVPRRDSPSTYTEHDGQQVWSKLDGKLLQEIAVRTSGVYIPAGTRSYDLGELYVNHLQGRNGDGQATQQRIRKSERFQIFLAIALLALLADLAISSFSPTSVQKVAAAPLNHIVTAAKEPARLSVVSAMLVGLLLTAPVNAGESLAKVREGLKLYEQQKFEEASSEFSAAEKELQQEKSADAAIAAFDEACAWHRKGVFEKARDSYLRAGLSKDREIATASHFNLATMSAENARKLAGEQPDSVPPDKRQAILDELKQSVAAYRHCLELQPDHAASRRNLELVRNWIKHYSDRWREIDRQKKRDETNLIQFLDFLLQTQNSLRDTVEQLPENTTADLFAELKRAQDELNGEIPTLREKIATELQPENASQNTTTPAIPQEVQEGISLLQSWANQAGENMTSAGRQLARQESKDATVEQQNAVNELDKIRDAVIPFQPLLTEELRDQTKIADNLKTATAPDESLESSAASSEDATAAPAQQTLPTMVDIEPLARDQEKTLRKARLLAPKADAELKQLESQPAPPTPSPPVDPSTPASQTPPQPAQPDPEAVKAGLRKAIELAPKAVEAMESAAQSLSRHDDAAAAPFAEEARRILEEIQKAQPSQEQEQQQKEQKQDQQSQDEKQDDQKKEDKGDQKQQDDKSKPKDDPKDAADQQKKKDESSDKKKESDQPKQDEKSGDKKSDEKKSKASDNKQADDQQRPISQDRIEEALRKVRERQQEKRERDREIRARVFGRAPVDKDW